MFISTFRYKPEYVACPLCTEYRKKLGCTVKGCPFLAERIEAGVVGYGDAVQNTLAHHTALAPRLTALIRLFPGTMWADARHKPRMEAFKARQGYRRHRDTPAYYAAMYLLTANEDLHRRTANCFCKRGLEFAYALLRGIAPHDYTLFVAEVASTVNENLLIEQLLQNENDPQTRLYLLNQYLENFKGTVYRQTMFAEFEREAHAMVERGEALNASALNALYKRLVIDYFGDDMVIDDEIQYEWARIPHFYRPFYVYKYATGYSTAVALSEGILKEGEPAVKRYKEFLSMGGSAYPLDELRHAGVDLATPAPVDAALEKFERILDDAEATLAKLQ